MLQTEFFISAFNTAEKAATAFFDIVTDTLAGPASTLRDGSEHQGVTLPRDLAAHSEAQTEWWYYTGHGITNSGRRFGFELVFFKRRTDLDRFSIVPLRLIGNPYYFAHFAITDCDKKIFRYAHRKSSNALMDFPAAVSEDRFYVRLGDWSVREAHNIHHLRATLDGDADFEASLKPLKDAIFHGPGGVSFKDDGEASRYFSYTRMHAEGEVVIDGVSEHFEGTAWMDREFGTWTPTERQKGWDWFSIQLENDNELMCYQLRDGDDNVSPYSSATFVDADGSAIALKSEDFSIEVLSRRQSPNSGAVYPNRWRIKIVSLGIDLSMAPVMNDQELDTRGTTMIVYWEGSCTVEGRVNGNPVAGNAYVELVGYDRSHEQPNLASFLLGRSINLPEWVMAKSKTG
ncbi:MAG: carotenoid 1,2-hydratase [Acidobacteria bacterium]|nr:carotenoid 1,2-hydratase [Acidobacteriota bacterium]